MKRASLREREESHGEEDEQQTYIWSDDRGQRLETVGRVKDHSKGISGNADLVTRKIAHCAPHNLVQYGNMRWKDLNRVLM